MKSSLFLSVVICFCTVRVSPKSVQFDGDKLANSEMKPQSVKELTPKSNDNVVWTRVEPSPQHGIPQEHEGNNSGNEEKHFSQSLSKFQELQANTDEMEIFTEKVGNWIEKIVHLKTEPHFPSISVIESVGSNDSQSQVFTNDTNLHELPSDASGIWNLSTPALPELELNDFSDSVVFNMVNLTEGAALLETLSENINSTESVTFDENAIMGEGSDIAFFQEVSTTGFEFLIDSETTKNFILTELLGSQRVLITEEDEHKTLFEGELSTLDTENFGFNQHNETVMSVTSLNHVASNETEEFDGEESKSNTNDADNTVGTEEIKNAGSVATECPEAGLCIFWFLAQDTCAENEHCLGSRICCKSGCSKTCVDVEF